MYCWFFFAKSRCLSSLKRLRKITYLYCSWSVSSFLSSWSTWRRSLFLSCSRLLRPTAALYGSFGTNLGARWVDTGIGTSHAAFIGDSMPSPSLRVELLATMKRRLEKNTKESAFDINKIVFPYLDQTPFNLSFSHRYLFLNCLHEPFTYSSEYSYNPFVSQRVYTTNMSIFRLLLRKSGWYATRVRPTYI